MFWAPMLAMAGLGALQGHQAERAQKKRNIAAAEANRYSPWTGKSFGQDFSADGRTLGGALQGGIAGASFGQQFGGGSPNAQTALQSGGFNNDVPINSDGMTSGSMLAQNQAPNYYRSMLNKKGPFA